LLELAQCPTEKFFGVRSDGYRERRAVYSTEPRTREENNGIGCGPYGEAWLLFGIF
jgi:hypothetical protein